MEDSKQASGAQEQWGRGKTEWKDSQGPNHIGLCKPGGYFVLCKEPTEDCRQKCSLICILKQSLAEAWRQRGGLCRDPRERPTRTWWWRES